MIAMFVFNVMASIRIFMRKWIHSLKGHHDQDSQGEKKWSTQVRHNKDLFTNAATPIFCIFLCIGIYVTSKNAMEFSVGNWGKHAFEITLKLLSFQNEKSFLFFQIRNSWIQACFTATSCLSTWLSLREFSTFSRQEQGNTFFKFLDLGHPKLPSTTQICKWPSEIAIPVDAMQVTHTPSLPFLLLSAGKSSQQKTYVALLFSSGGNHFALLARNSNKRKLKHW